MSKGLFETLATYNRASKMIAGASPAATTEHASWIIRGLSRAVHQCLKPQLHGEWLGFKTHTVERITHWFFEWHPAFQNIKQGF